MKTIGDRIRLRREELQLSQEELAKRCGYTSRSTIYAIEKNCNKLRQDKILIFAKALDTTPAYIMGWTEEQSEAIDTAMEDARLVAKYRALPPEDRAIIDNLLDSLYAKAQTRKP